MEPETVAPAIEGVKARRADLHNILIELEHSIAAAAPGREPQWTQGVRDALDRLTEAFASHVSATESADGLFEQVRRRAPRLDHHCQRLAEDHGRITAELTTAIAALDTDVAGAREAVLSLLAHLARHRQLGADLVYEAYAVDLGGSD